MKERWKRAFPNEYSDTNLNDRAEKIIRKPEDKKVQK
jgi:hypothetical protein